MSLVYCIAYRLIMRLTNIRLIFTCALLKDKHSVQSVCSRVRCVTSMKSTSVVMDSKSIHSSTNENKKEQVLRESHTNKMIELNKTSALTADQIVRIRERYNRVLPLRTEPHKSGNGFNFYTNGFGFDDFNRAGCIELRNVSRTFEWPRFIQWELMGGFVETPNNAYITSVLEVCLSKNLYRKAVISHPLKVSLHVSQIGTSSFQSIQYLRMVNLENPYLDGEILASRRMVYINVDISGETKKSIHIPKDVRKRCQNMLSNSEIPSLKEFQNLIPLRRDGNSSTGKTNTLGNSASEGKQTSRDPFNFQSQSTPPPHAFLCTIIPRAEDCDLFSHVTLSTYFSYIREAETQMAAAGLHLPKGWEEIPADPVERMVSKSGLELKKELKVWEPLKIFCWFDDVNVGVVHFVFKNNKDEITSLAFLEYHSGTEDIDIPAKL